MSAVHFHQLIVNPLSAVASRQWVISVNRRGVSVILGGLCLCNALFLQK